MIKRVIWILLVVLSWGCNSDDETPVDTFILQSVRIGSVDLQINNLVVDIPIEGPILLRFNQPVDQSSVQTAISLNDEDKNPVPYTPSYLDSDQTISLGFTTDLDFNTVYTLEVSDLRSINGQSISSGDYSFQTAVEIFSSLSITVEGDDLLGNATVQDIITDPLIVINFAEPIAADQQFEDLITLENTRLIPANLDFTLDPSGTSLSFSPGSPLDYIAKYNLTISDQLSNESGGQYVGSSHQFYTQIDSAFKFPEISTDELLTKVQQQTFKYFWDFAHPVSGLARERNTSGDLVTSGGSGFGLMAIIVGIERDFITRAEGVERINTIVDFLEGAQRFHGVWSHWLNGNDGTVIPFSEFDDGGDLVETSYLVQGLLTVRQYLNPTDVEESLLIDKINALWEDVEWDWYTQGDQNQLYWHYSNNFQWRINLPIRGYNEALITYVLAAASPTHAIGPEVYHQGWADNGNIENGEEYFGYTLPLGQPLGGPLFFAHYTFLGLDPRNLQDDYGEYWTQNVNHSLINYQYCQENSGDFVGYGAGGWGLTASDNHIGYNAHSPTNDLGVITPTAALSSIPYTPDQSIEALNHFYYLIGDKLWGEYGFFDAYNFTEEWVADSYLAIDQGPIILMIENYRTGLLWDLFMSAPEVQDGLDKLNFTY